MKSESFYRGERFKLKGKRIILRTLKRNDIKKRLKWKKYSDPLYFHYNLSELTEAQQEEWFLKKKIDPKILYLAIDNLKGELLGFLSLFEINLKYKKAKLGIYLG